MWKFLGKIIMAAVGVIVIFFCINLGWYHCTRDSHLVAFEIYDAASFVQQSTEYTALLLGDSVTRQIFNAEYQGESDRIAYLATNQALTPAGNYMLLRKFHETNPQLEEVYYIAAPGSFFSNVNFQYTYSYFVTPLYNDAFKQYLAEDTCDRLEETFGRVFMDEDYPKWMLARYPKLLELFQSNRASAYFRRTTAGKPVPNMSVLYLEEMRRYCSENGIALHLLFAPVPEGYPFETYDFSFLKENGDEKLYNDLMDSLYYIDVQEFIDGVHLKSEYLSENREVLKERLVVESHARVKFL